MFKKNMLVRRSQSILCLLGSIFIAALTSAQGGAIAEIRNKLPNIVIIYTDDQASLDLGSYGAEDLRTPELDALAQEGIRFTNMYAPSAVCSASRAGLLTGMLPNRVGVPANVSSTRGQSGMAGKAVTMAEYLTAAGYRTGHIGKWHLGYTPETMPNAQGFEYSWGHMSGVIDRYSHFFYWEGPPAHDLWRNGHEIWESGGLFSDLTKQAQHWQVDGQQTGQSVFGDGRTRAGSEVEHEECDRGYKPKDDSNDEQRTGVWRSTHGCSETHGGGSACITVVLFSMRRQKWWAQ
jgi:arylsulfatase A-like enzyme